MSTQGEQYAKAVAAELRAERARQQVTVASLVERTGISKSAVLHYLNAHRIMPVGALAALSQALGVKASTIAARAEAALEEQS